MKGGISETAVWPSKEGNSKEKTLVSKAFTRFSSLYIGFYSKVDVACM